MNNKTLTDYRNFGFNVIGNDGERYMTLDTRDLPRDLTAWELAQLLNLAGRYPESVVRRDFATVAHLFRPVTP